MKRTLVSSCVLFLIGCQSSTHNYSTNKPRLVHILESYGVTDTNTAKVILLGTEGLDDGGARVVIDTGFEIQRIWDTIYQSRPTECRFFCGCRGIQFFTNYNANTPDVELSVNITERCHVTGTIEEGFRCPGINEIIAPPLKAEYKRMKTHAIMEIDQTR